MKRNFSLEDLRNSEEYKNAIMNSYRIYLDDNDSFIRFSLSKRKKQTELSGKIYTLKQFREQLIIYMQELI
ncbi:hypothetical protein [uncultured Tenacibaculum sp.]|uniref:hypothetical protein n=1 Tax=uncultured Tenacibaculum sp. TaxID=174713 RepID=UPI002629858F|nr:hypothetical protein [uncultured Tenacibaculum sp.]